MILFFGAILGFISVAFGAYAEHGLKGDISAEQFSFIMTAIRYNQVHAVIASAIGMVLLTSKSMDYIKLLVWCGVLFIVGTFIFCFSIYFSVVFEVKELTKITPAGGMTIMLAWVLLAVFGVFSIKRK